MRKRKQGSACSWLHVRDPAALKLARAWDEQGKKAKAAYSSMYKSFCADATKSSSAVCSNAVLKNIYGK